MASQVPNQTLATHAYVQTMSMIKQRSWAVWATAELILQTVTYGSMATHLAILVVFECTLPTTVILAGNGSVTSMSVLVEHAGLTVETMRTTSGTSPLQSTAKVQATTAMTYT